MLKQRLDSSPSSRSARTRISASIANGWGSGWCRDLAACGAPYRLTPCSASGRSAIGLADDIGNAFRPHLRRVLTSSRYLAVLAGLKRLSLVVAGDGDLAAEYHDARVKVVRVQLLGGASRLTAMHDLETLATQVAFERLAGEGPAV